MQPINYGVEIEDPTKSFLSAFQTGSAIQDTRLKQEQQQQKVANEKLIQEGFLKLRQPGAKASDYANLAMMLPETQAKAVRESFNMLTEERQQNALQQSGQIFSAFKAGKPEIAISLLERQIEAKRNSGDNEGAKFLETWRDVAKENPKVTEDYFGFTISQMPGGDKVITSAIALSGEGREQAKAPSALIEAKAKADRAVAEATVAQATATNAADKAKADVDKAKADADKAKIDAQYAERNALQELENKVATLGLTKAQTNEFNVRTRNLNTTGKLLKLDYDAAIKGLPLPSKNAGTTTTVGNATEDERKAAGWLSQANNAYTNMLSAMYTSKGIRTGAEEPGFFEATGLPGVSKQSQSEERQRFNQAAGSLSEALLRAATGAGVNEAEARQKIEELTPTYLDKKTNIEQKLTAIPMYLQSLQSRAGRAAPPGYKIPEAPSSPSSVSGKVTRSNSAIVDGQTYTRPANFTDAQWNAYKQSVGAK